MLNGRASRPRAGHGLAAIALDAFERDQRIFHESRRQVVLGHLRQRLEDLEMMPPRRGPEHDMCLERWAPWHAASELRYHQGFVVSQRKVRLRPAAHAGNSRRAIGAFRGKVKHGNLDKPRCEAGSSRPAAGKETSVVEKVLAAVR